MQRLTGDQRAAGRDAVQPAAAVVAAAAAVAELEARVAALHTEAQRLNKIAGQEAAAAAVYKELAALDDQALHLQLQHALPPDPGRAAAHAAAHPHYCRLLAPAPAWADVAAPACGAAQLRRRALHAVLGYALGDAAACSCQWVYSEAQLQTLAQGRAGLEFYDPPQCPFFEYRLGSASPYGEQTAALAESLARAGGLNWCRYAADLFAAFGPSFGGYRDRSTKSFLRRYAAGALPPSTGSPDDQANAFTRLPPLVALYAGAGRGRLLAAAECMIRVTQNDPIAVAYGCAAALVLEAVVLGASVAAAVADTVAWLQQQAGSAADARRVDSAGQPPQTKAAGDAAADDDSPAAREVGSLAEPVVPPALWGEVADRLVQAAELAPVAPLEAATRLGRNCHLPNSLQTPLQILLHLEWKQAGGAPQPDVAASGSGQGAATVEPAAAGPASAQGAAAGEEACVPCSLGGGTACPLPARRAGQRAAPGSAVLKALVGQQESSSEPASLPPEAFIEAVRLAIRPGGCCASRAGLAGALAAALVAGSSSGEDGDVALPRDWMQRMQGWDAAVRLAERLVALRD